MTSPSSAVPMTAPQPIAPPADPPASADRPAVRGFPVREVVSHALRQAAVWLALSSAVGALIIVQMHGPAGLFTVHGFEIWIYSLCIGLAVQTLIQAGRRAATAWLRRRRPETPQLRANWPGWPFMGVWSVLSSVVGYLIGGSVADGLFGADHIARILAGGITPLASTAHLTLLAALGSCVVFYALGRLRHAEAAAEAQRRQAAEHQLKLLESQLEPHMLFNTLANLRVLIAIDPPRAQQMLDRLIAFLRGTLGASLAREHALAAEFDRLDDYLSLMKIRMGPRLRVELDLPAHLRDAAVPTLLLQPVVENAIKHGLEPQIEGGLIAVQARQDNDVLLITVRDTGRGLPSGLDPSVTAGPSQGTGFGMSQIRQRLATLYGRSARVLLRPGADGVGVEVVIHLPLHRIEFTTDPADPARRAPAEGATP
jgi:hypothetical protein